ncbi:MAG: CMP-3-deoxy-D-manno-octulosonate--lipid tetraacyldisaccharide 3-deoxy-D-manno-octulosonate [Planctomycetota bacterium]
MARARAILDEHGGDAPCGVEPPPPPLRGDPHPGARDAVLHAAYDLLMLVALVLASPWLAWRWCSSPAFRRLAPARLARRLPARGARRRVLVHGVSVGEVKAAQSIIRELERTRPDLEVVVCTTTDTGEAMARRTYPHLVVVRFPLDLRPVVRRFLRVLDPACVVLVELEVWPNFLREANRRGVPLVVVNGRITERSHRRYGRARALLPAFDRLSLLLAQDEEYARRFASLCRDGSRIRVTGNVKVDGLGTGRAHPGEELARLLGPAPGDLCLVGGSTHDPEELLVARAARASGAALGIVLVPRHPDRAASVANALRAAGFEVQLLTELRRGREPSPRAVRIVDTIGELEGVYALADIVVVGGSFVPHGGQNLLEPAAQRRCVLHGPHMWNFAAETRLLQRRAGALEVPDEEGLAQALRALAGDPARRAAMGANGLEAVELQRGATARTMAWLEPCLPRAEGGLGAGAAVDAGWTTPGS